MTDTEQPKDEAGPAPAPADVREQMRLALERKKAKGGRGGRGGGPDGGDKASEATSNHTVHREFRRKSGG